MKAIKLTSNDIDILKSALYTLRSDIWNRDNISASDKQDVIYKRAGELIMELEMSQFFGKEEG